MKKNVLHIGAIIILILGLALVACDGSTPAPDTDDSDTGDTQDTDDSQDTGDTEDTNDTEETMEETDDEETSVSPSDLPTEEMDAVSSDLMLDAAALTDGDESALMVSSYIHETLITLDGDTPQQALAVGWELADDALAWRFDLRPGVTFHDGTPFNADAVIVNFNRWFNPEDELRGSGDFQAFKDVFGGFEGEVSEDGEPLSNFDGIEKVDNLTVLIHLHQPDDELSVKLASAQFAFASPAALAEAGDAYGTMDYPPVGTGPYMVVDWGDGKLFLQVNPNYWGEIPGSNLEFPVE